MSRIIEARFEQTGTAWWQFSYDVDKNKCFDDDSWPEMDNTDTELVAVTLEDGSYYNIREREAREQLAKLVPDLDDQIDEIYEAHFEADWPSQDTAYPKAAA